MSIGIAGYTFLTVMNWYVFGRTNKYLITILSSEEVRSLTSGREFVRDALVNNTSGLLGRFINILMLLVFRIILARCLKMCRQAGADQACLLADTQSSRRAGARRCQSSAMFGTITGGPVVNVLSTGVLTIPMMLKRGFSRVFAGGGGRRSGGVDHAADRALPPSGVLTGVPYRDIIIAAAIPALFYFLCLFLSIIFQARKQNIQAIGELTDDMRLNSQDRLHLLQIFAPVLLILVLLLTPKDSIGCSWVSVMLGAVVERNGEICTITSLPWIIQLLQNAAGDASAAGWWAVMLLMALMFMDREFRSHPRKVLDGLSQAGVLVSTLYLMFLAVTVIDVA